MNPRRSKRRPKAASPKLETDSSALPKRLYVDGRAIAERRKELGLSQASLHKICGISARVLSDLENNRGAISRATAETLAEQLSIDIRSVQRTGDYHRSSDWRFTAEQGLFDDVEPIVADDAVPWQSFIYSTNNDNPIALLWADGRGGRIHARIYQDDDETGPYAQIEFYNPINRYPCVVSFHPEGNIARRRTPEQRYLTFEARAINQEPSSPKIAVAVRVTDENWRQWEYRNRSGYQLFQVATYAWKRFVVDLDPDNDALRWINLFGRPRPGAKPQFRLLNRVSFEVGLAEGARRPGYGQGVLQVRQIKLASSDTQAPLPKRQSSRPPRPKR